VSIPRRLACLLLVLAGCSSDVTATTPAASRPGWPAAARLEVVATYPHDTGAFTQGLVVGPDGRLFESVGNEDGRGSDVRETELATGKVLDRRPLPGDQFAEGLTISGDELIQLTWTDEVAYRWDVDGLGARGTSSYTGEGWGLSTDGDQLVMSDGSSTLQRRDPDTFEVLDHLDVRLGDEAVDRLNELEVLDGGLVAANVWQTDRIVVVDLEDGAVVSVVDASDLVPEGLGPDEVLNGIAHRPGDPPRRWLVTGKNWPVIYVVEVVASRG
jgi:glutamine cyclotransferase